MTPTGHEHDIRLASEGWDSATCDSVTNANLGFIEGIAECLRAMGTGATNVSLKKMGVVLADAAEIISCANTRRDRIRRDEEMYRDAMAATKKTKDKNDQERKKPTLRDKFFFNHLDEEGWELYKKRFLGAQTDEETEMRQAFEDLLKKKSVPTDTNILNGPVSAS